MWISPGSCCEVCPKVTSQWVRAIFSWCQKIFLPYCCCLAGLGCPLLARKVLCCWTDTCQGHPRDLKPFRCCPSLAERSENTLDTGDVRNSYSFPLSQQIGGVRTGINCSIQNTPPPLPETGQNRQKPAAELPQSRSTWGCSQCHT